MILEIDYRERDIISQFEKQEINYKIVNLEIGDFIYKNDKEDIILIIERKSFADLCSSINDGRFREQKSRLSESVPTDNIMYILEGEKNVPKIHNIPKKTINSCMLNMIFRDKYKILVTDGVTDTYENIVLLYNKLESNEFSVCNAGKVTLIKKSKKINDNIFIHQLSVVPGVSIAIAQKIKEKYKSMNELVLQFKDKYMLCDIQITDKRKLGKKLSEKIYTSLF